MASPGTSPETDWQFLRFADLPKQLNASIASATGRAALQTMAIICDDVTNPLFDGMMDFHLRTGGELAIATDFQSTILTEGTRKKPDEEKAALFDMLQRVTSLGPEARSYINMPHTRIEEILRYNTVTRMFKVDHRKAAVYDDDSYLMSTILYADAFDPTDTLAYAVHGKHPVLADTLFGIIKDKVLERRPVTDTATTLEAGTSVLLHNTGRFGRSLILDTTIAFVEDAEPDTIRFVSQHKPGGRLEDRIRQAEPLAVAYNPTERLPRIFQAEKRLTEKRSKQAMPNTIHPEPYVHGQTLTMIVKRNQDRNILPDHAGPVTITGNDNFYWATRWWCPAELDLVSTDEHLYEQATSTIDIDLGQ